MRSFRGPLGAQCAGEACNLPVVKFQPVPGAVEEISEQLEKELSTDQQLLYRLARAVQSDDLCFADREPFCNTLAITSRVLQNVTARRDIGAFNHARWLTLAVRLLLLYASTERPSATLVQLVRLLLGTAVCAHLVPDPPQQQLRGRRPKPAVQRATAFGSCPAQYSGS